MKQAAWVSVTSVVVVAAACRPVGNLPTFDVRVRPSQPAVYVVEREEFNPSTRTSAVVKRIVVDQEPTLPQPAGSPSAPGFRPVSQQNAPVMITLKLERLSGYEFKADTIEFCTVPYRIVGDGKQCDAPPSPRPDCAKSTPHQIVCTYSSPGAGVVWYYRLQIKDPASSRPIELDPSIMN